MAQVRVIFSLRDSDAATLFPPDKYPPRYMAYVEWFSPFQRPDPVHGMYKVQRQLRDGGRPGSIIPLTSIQRSVHLLPIFGPDIPPHWTSANVLDECPKFLVNSYTDRHTHGTIF